MIRILKNLFLIHKKYPFFIITSIIAIIANILGMMMYKGHVEIFSSFDNPSLAFWNQSGMYFTLLFFPVTLSIIISISIFNSKQNKGFYIERLAPISPLKMIGGRVIYFILLNIVTMFSFLMSFYLISYIMNVKIVSPFLYVYWSAMGIIGLLPLIGLQIIFSLLFNNKSIPILLSIIGSLANFLLMKTPVSWLDPYALMSLGMRTQQLTIMTMYEWLSFIIINSLYIILFITVSARILKMKLYSI